MKTIIIDCRRCKTKEETHRYLAKKLCFPPYYGNNLDALNDVLTSWEEPVCFRIRYPSSIKNNLGRYGETLIRVFENAALENRNLMLEFK